MTGAGAPVRGSAAGAGGGPSRLGRLHRRLHPVREEGAGGALDDSRGCCLGLFPWAGPASGSKRGIGIPGTMARRAGDPRA